MVINQEQVAMRVQQTQTNRMVEPLRTRLTGSAQKLKSTMLSLRGRRFLVGLDRIL
jgi:hypothetical protein